MRHHVAPWSVKRNDSLVVVLRNDWEIERKIAPSPDAAVGIAVMMLARFASRRLPQGTFAELRRSAWCAVNFGGRPMWTPRAWARACLRPFWP